MRTIIKCVVVTGNTIHYKYTNYKACTSLCQHENNTISPGRFKKRCPQSIFIGKAKVYDQEFPKMQVKDIWTRHKNTGKKSGKFGRSAKFGRRARLFYVLIIGIKND